MHPGGPFWAKKDVWGIPKGICKGQEDPQDTACREFEEEIGQPPPAGDTVELGEIKVSGGKVIKAWAVEGDLDVSHIRSNTTTIEWPPSSGRKVKIPEVDKAQWFEVAEAYGKMHKGQNVFLQRLAEHLNLGLDFEAPKPEQGSLF